MPKDETPAVPAYAHSQDGEKSLVSTTDCTGLISARPDDEEEAFVYSGLYNIPVNESFKGPCDEN